MQFDDESIINTTFSELMTVLIFITLVFIGVDYAKLVKLRSENAFLTEENKKINDELDEEKRRSGQFENEFADFFSRLGITIEEDDTPISTLVAIENIFQKNSKEYEEFKKQYEELIQKQSYETRRSKDLLDKANDKLRSLGNGVGVCWQSERKRGDKIEYFLDVIAHEKSLTVFPAWESYREPFLKKMSTFNYLNKKCKAGCNMNFSEFSRVMKPIHSYSNIQAEVEGIPCNFQVRYFKARESTNDSDSQIWADRYFATNKEYRKTNYIKWLQTKRRN